MSNAQHCNDGNEIYAKNEREHRSRAYERYVFVVAYSDIRVYMLHASQPEYSATTWHREYGSPQLNLGDERTHIYILEYL